MIIHFTTGIYLATRTGFEPVSSSVTGKRNRPDYANEPKIVESVSRPDPMDSLYYRPSEHFLQTVLIDLQVR